MAVERLHPAGQIRGLHFDGADTVRIQYSTDTDSSHVYEIEMPVRQARELYAHLTQLLQDLKESGKMRDDA
jgi:hypothetical protein